MLALVWAMLETFSWAMLRSGLTRPDSTARLLVDSFPAVFRLERSLRIEAARGQKLRPRAPLAFDIFAFDPALAFRNVGYLRWYTTERASEPAEFRTWPQWWDRFAAEARGRLVVVCFGGSTTASAQPANWPRQVADLLALHGISQPAIVLNAGHNGFMTMQEQLWASYWILPELDRRGIVPAVALSLDGVNDVSYGLGGWQAYRRFGNEPWLKAYNGFYQVVDEQTRSTGQPGRAFAAFWSALLSTQTGDRVVQEVAAALPTTLAFARRVGQHQDYPPIVENLLAWRMHNVFRIRDVIVAVPWSSGALDVATEAPFYPTAKIARSLREVITFIETKDGGARSADLDLSTLKGPDLRRWTSLPDLEISEQVLDEILNAFRSNLLAFQSAFAGRGIAVISALQPIADPDSNPYVSKASGKDIPDFDYVLAHWAMSGAQPGAMSRAPARALYRSAAKLYRDLGVAQPGRFVDLTGVFSDATEDYFTGDNIHYTPRGSLRIASALVTACLEARRCGTAATPTLADADLAPLADAARFQDDAHPHVVASRNGFNIVRFGGRYWGVRQDAGNIAWDDQNLAAIPDLIVAYTQAEAERTIDTKPPVAPGAIISDGQPPVLIGSVGTYNIVRFNRQFYALPQALGEVKWGKEDVGALPGVIVAASEAEARRRLDASQAR